MKDVRKNPEQVKVRVGKRFEVQVEVCEEDGEIIYKVISIKWWFFTVFTMSISLLALVLQIVSMID